MKITKDVLRQIIEEELATSMSEYGKPLRPDDLYKPLRPKDLNEDEPMPASDHISDLAADDSFLASVADLEALLSAQLERGDISQQAYDEAMEVANRLKVQALANN